jgi:GNAT superfamily N-acetyltransferase
MGLILRKWRPEDIPAMVAQTFQWGFETTEEKISAHLNRIDRLDNAEVFVAELDGKVAGRVFVTEHITLGSEPFAEVHALVVNENYRRLGIGKALIEKAVEWSREKGFGILRLRTNANRPEANVFYPAIGFNLDKVQNVYSIRL